MTKMARMNDPNVDPWPVDTITTYPLVPSRRGDGTVTRGEGPRTLDQHELAERQAARRKKAIERAAQAFADGLLTAELMTPREQAEAAWSRTSPYTVDELEDRIRIERGMTPIHGSIATSDQARRAKKGGANS
ncbi:MAG TPA: hypothetical protein VGE38_09915 [Nocardioides sp.]|uniref:ImmA/IrrE family metallo-endopeptidase n=1 Tax=Nocardioides sp. TaxID=35761 RepID=UPI002ED970D4